MVVADASVVVDLLLGPGGKAGEELAMRLANGEVICAPHLLDVEVGQVLRRFVLKGDLAGEYAQLLVDELALLPVTRYPHSGLVSRALQLLQLLQNITVYDGIYLALAEVLDCTLLTGDTKLQDVPGSSAEVLVLQTRQK